MVQDQAMSSFTKPLDLRFLDAPLKERPFMLLTEFEYHVGGLDSGEVITVPRGYRTDFASIPRFFHRLLNPVGRHGKAAVIHDWLCDAPEKEYNYIEAADIFGEAMEVLGVPKWKRSIMVMAVKMGGPRF